MGNVLARRGMPRKVWAYFVGKKDPLEFLDPLNSLTARGMGEREKRQWPGEPGG